MKIKLKLKALLSGALLATVLKILLAGSLLATSSNVMACSHPTNGIEFSVFNKSSEFGISIYKGTVSNPIGGEWQPGSPWNNYDKAGGPKAIIPLFDSGVPIKRNFKTEFTPCNPGDYDGAQVEWDFRLSTNNETPTGQKICNLKVLSKNKNVGLGSDNDGSISATLFNNGVQDKHGKYYICSYNNPKGPEAIYRPLFIGNAENIWGGSPFVLYDSPYQIYVYNSDDPPCNCGSISKN